MITPTMKRFVLLVAIVGYSAILSLAGSHKTKVSSSCPSVKITKINKGRVIHRFFDTSPMSPSGKYLALFRLPYENKSPLPGDAGEVILVNRKTGKEKVVALTRGWEVQTGANVQWGATDKELFFNDVDTLTWKAYAVKINPLTGELQKMGGTVFMVSPDGKKLASHNLLSSRFAQVGYGVMVPDKFAGRNIGPVGSDGVYITTVSTGVCKMIVSIKEIFEKTAPTVKIPDPEAYEYYCFQVKWNPQGDRLLTTLQWAPIEGGPRKRAVITMREDGSELKTAITPEQWARGGHHINWAPDGEHLSMNLNADGKPGLEIITVKYDGSELKIIYSPGSGHPSFHPGGLPFIVTDAYPYEKVAASGDGNVPVRLIDLGTNTEQILDKVFLTKQNGEFRIDAHPVWDRSGRYVIYNGFENGTRVVFIADLGKITGR